jgi:cyclase
VYCGYYPEAFAAVGERDNVFAVQFHPEKSGNAGLAVLTNFVTLPRVAPVATRSAPELHRAPARRIIPCLDVDRGRVVKGVRFVQLRDSGNPAELAAAYNQAGADELVLLDISASHESWPILIDTVRRTALELFIPFTVGGGVRSVKDAGEILAAGADKVSVNTAAVENPKLISELARAFGSQAVIAAIDARRTATAEKATNAEPDAKELRFEVFTHGGRTATRRDAIEWARCAAEMGAGEILLTSMDCDGTKAGFDCELTAAVSMAVPIPVIASGGGGARGDFVRVFTEGAADAALAASIFHFGEIGVRELKQSLRCAGIPVRLP